MDFFWGFLGRGGGGGISEFFEKLTKNPNLKREVLGGEGVVSEHTSANVSNGTSTPQGEHLCKIILKSMHKCRSYGQDKLNL